MAKIFPEEKLSFIFSRIRGRSSSVVRLWTKSSRETRDQASAGIFVPVEPGHDASPELHEGERLGFHEMPDNFLLVGAFFNEPGSSEKSLGSRPLALEIGSGGNNSGEKTLGEAGFICFSPKPFKNSERASETEEAVISTRLNWPKFSLAGELSIFTTGSFKKKVAVFFFDVSEVVQILAADHNDKIVFEFGGNEGKIARVDGFFFRRDIDFESFVFFFDRGS